MNALKRNIPNAITCLNVTAGTIAILFVLGGDRYPALHAGGMTPWAWACVMIGVAAVADFLDGFAARALRAYSDLGKELDSLCDLVSFGVAPAAILFSVLNDLSPASWTAWAVPVIPVAGALRLARFNIDTRQATSFIGLPIPANALFWIGYTALCLEGTATLTEWWIAVPVILLESWLMLSPLPLFSLKFKTWTWKGNEARWLLIATAIAAVVLAGTGGLLWLIVCYLVISLFPFARKS